ncbi:hypothetical protein PN36_20925 [Candidatus Thiomargarita nelsonii]|uniref:Uncharacterized protein n=1 Tax=Candidatus Thiomargarita nelsonii TaxID=1003181 RepID=A0A0A6RSC6_9GAMM|nr:hypothetical protein PN36_20925 [Candidatus Thiomargarita nelsonii]
MPQAGEIYYHPDYIFPDGDQKNKYVLIMGVRKSGDFILARTTSRENLRVTHPRCSHTFPYPGFYVGTANGLFSMDTWIVLDRLDDYDEIYFTNKIRNGQINFVGILADELFCDLLDCAVRSNDVTREQEQRMLDLRTEKCS